MTEVLSLLYTSKRTWLLHGGTMLVGFLVSILVEYVVNGGSTDLFHFHAPMESILLFVTLFVMGSFVVLFDAYRREAQQASMALRSTGVVGVVFGLGCVSCGSALFLPLLSLVGISGVVIAFSRELQVFGIVLLVVASLVLLNALGGKRVCVTESKV